MEILSAHRSATRQFDTRVHLVRDTQWDNSTPCTEWTVRDLVNHVVYEQLWVPDLLAGKTIAEVGDRYEGDVLGDDPIGAWEQATEKANAAWAEPDVLDRTVHLSYASVPAGDYLQQLLVDLAVHAWDLARGIDADDEMPNDLTAAVLAVVKENQAEFAGSGAFAESLDTSACTDDLTETLAILGRARWKSFDPTPR